MFVNVMLTLHTLTLLVISLLLARLVFPRKNSSIDVEEETQHVEPTLSDFDKRILAFQKELNTPTYDDTAQTYHPGVYNVPHDTVKDVPIKHEEEYAK